jgi:hypothetical protein
MKRKHYDYKTNRGACTLLGKGTEQNTDRIYGPQRMEHDTGKFPMTINFTKHKDSAGLTIYNEYRKREW